MTELNGFHYVTQLTALDEMFNRHPPVSCDVFIQTLISIDGNIQPKAKISVVPGEVFQPDYVRIGRDGHIQFWFKPEDPTHEHRTARFGMSRSDLADAFPDMRLTMKVSELARLDEENARAVGQRIKVIDVINEALAARQVADVEQEQARVEAEKDKLYESDPTGGLF